MAASIQMILSYFNRNIIENTENGGHGYSQERIYIDNASCGGTGCNINQNTADYIHNTLQQHMSDITNNYNGQDLVFNSIPQNYFGNTFLQQQFFASYVLESLHNNVPVIFAYFDQTLNGWHSIIINSISVNENDYSDAIFNYIDPNGPSEYSFDTQILGHYLSRGGYLIGGVGRPDFRDYNFDLVSHDGDLNYPQFDYHSLDDVMSCISGDIKYKKNNKCYIKPSIKVYYNDKKEDVIVVFDANPFKNTKSDDYNYYEIHNINLGKLVNPIDYFNKIEFLGDIDDNCWGTKVVWGNPNWNAWIYHNKPGCEDNNNDTFKVKGMSIKKYFEEKNNNFHEVIKNQKVTLDDIFVKKDKYHTYSLQDFDDQSGLKSISIKQQFGLTWYWENDNYYLQVITHQYSYWKNTNTYLKSFIKLGNGIRLYND